LGLVLVVANMAVRTSGASWLAFALKTACGVVFCALGLTAFLRLGGRYPGLDARPVTDLGVLILIGLAFGLLGDISLSLKDLFAGAYNRYLFGGFLLFAAGHVAYIAALIRGWHTPFPWVPIVVCAVLAIGFVVSDRVLHLKFGRFKWVVAGYGVLLALLPAMGFFTMATGTHPAGSPGILVQPTVMAVAGVCFLVSDLVLAWTYFGSSKDRGWEHVVCYLFYYAAQFGIAASLLWV